MKIIFKNKVLGGLLFIISFQFCSCSCHLINTKGGGSYSRDVEFVTAMLRAPAVIAIKLTKQGKKAHISRLIVDLTRIVNDGLTLCRLVQEKDENWYKWTKVLWIAQDFIDLISLVQSGIKGGDQQIKINVSDIIEDLNIFVLPFCEGAAATALAYYGNSKGRNVSLCLQAIISGSRLLSEMIESGSGSSEQKIVILKTVIHGLVVLIDCLLPDLKN